MGFALLGLLGGQFVIWFWALEWAVGGAGDGFCAIAENENAASRTINADLFMTTSLFQCRDCGVLLR